MDEHHGRALRDELLALLAGRGAHMTLDEAVTDFPADAVARRPPNVRYTPWQLLEHIRLTQADILDYVRDAEAYVERPWPEAYWPRPDELGTPDALEATLAAYRADRAALRAIVADPSVDPLAILPGTPGHTVFREVRIVVDHDAYHIGEFAILRQVMGTWPIGRRD